MARSVAPVNRDPDRDIDEYLLAERKAGAWRVLAVGAVALVLGGAGSLALYHFWVEVGVVPRLLFAGPLVALIGLVLFAWGVVARSRVRARP